MSVAKLFYMQKLDEHVLANAAATTAFAGSVLYYLFYVVSPNTYMIFQEARLFGLDISSLQPAAYGFAELIQGGIAFAVIAWVMGLIFARVYNGMQQNRGRSRR